MKQERSLDKRPASLLAYCWFIVWRTLRLWKWRRYVTPKRRWPSIELHGFTSQKVVIFYESIAGCLNKERKTGQIIMPRFWWISDRPEMWWVEVPVTSWHVTYWSVIVNCVSMELQHIRTSNTKTEFAEIKFCLRVRNPAPCSEAQA